MPEKPKSTVVSVSVDGGALLETALRKLGSVRTLNAAATAMQESGELIVRDSKENYVPIKSGNLRDTIKAQLAIVTDDSVTVALTAGSSAITYAAVVHETNRAYRNGKQWKYLETPAKTASTEVVSRLANKLRSAFGG